jgi:transcription initiation factor TFIIH subunit 4
VVAYTQSTLHYKMLQVFVNVRCRLPNVVIGFITRESVRRAMAKGITAESMLSFLRQHAHPAVRKNSDRLIPENVDTQVALWFREKHRIKYEEAVMIDMSGYSVEEFDDARDFARAESCLLWATDVEGVVEVEPSREHKKMLFVTDEGLNKVRERIEDRRFKDDMFGDRR